MQLYTYQKAFITKYSQASARLEVELITSQQRMREAFSNEALSKAKQLQTDLEKFQEVSWYGYYCSYLYNPLCSDQISYGIMLYQLTVLTSIVYALLLLTRGTEL